MNRCSESEQFIPEDAAAGLPQIAFQMSFLFDTLTWPVVFPQLSTLE